MTRGLAAKGLAALGAGGAVAVGYMLWKPLDDSDGAKKLLEKVGLVCNEQNVCSLPENGKINVMHGETKEDGKTFTASGNQKLKYQLLSSGDYNGNVRLAVEGGDITLTADASTSSSTISKLEEFETYEIKEDNGKYYLSRKEKKLEAQWRLLGLPAGDNVNCKLPESENTTLTCSLDKAKLGTIRFQGKADGGAVTVENEATMKFKVSKTSAAPFNGSGYKFVLETNKNISIAKSEGTISIKKGTNTEFRIKITQDSSGTKTLTLEKAWSVEELGQKSGFSECWNTESYKKCTFKTNVSFNVMNGESNKFEGVKLNETKTMTYEEDVEDHNQGFKFSVDAEINLNGNNNKKIHKSNASYEIVEKTEESSAKWYLSKKGVGGGS